MPLSTACGGPDLQHLATPVRIQARVLRGLRDLLQRRAGRLLVRDAAVVEDPDRVLVLERHAEALQVRPEVLGGETA